MVDVDVQTELTQVSHQLEQLIVDYNKKDAEMKQLMQQIQNLNGITMYLRGKIEDIPQTEKSTTNNVSQNEVPDIAEIVNDT